MTKINNQQPSEFAGKIFIILTCCIINGLSSIPRGFQFTALERTDKTVAVAEGRWGCMLEGLWSLPLRLDAMVECCWRSQQAA